LDFENKSGLAARLFFGALNENTNGAWVVARGTYRLSDDNLGLDLADEPWPVFTTPLETEFGVFPPDDYPFRSKVELIVVGTATSAKPVRSLEVSVRAGKFSHRLVVFGDRRWLRGQDGKLVPSEPQPFVEMKLGLDNAFGGTSEYGGDPLPHPLNPKGKGFYASEELAVGQPLPNVEQPDALVTKWSDQPPVATWAPVDNGPLWQMAARIAAHHRANTEAITQPMVEAWGRKTFPTASPPALHLDELKPFEPIAVDLGGDKFQFPAPNIRLPLRVKVGKRKLTKPLSLSGIWIFAPKRLVVITWLGKVRYDLVPKERRSAVLARR